MATTLSKIHCSCNIGATLTDTLEGVARSEPGGLAASLTLTAGTTANKVDRWIQDKDRLLNTGNSWTENLDLFDLAGFDQTTDLLGNTVTCADIVGLYVFNHANSDGDLHVGGLSATTAWNSLFIENGAGTTDDVGFILKPGGFSLFGAPTDPAYAVADTTNHLLKMLAASGANVTTYDIGVLPRSA